MTVSTLVLYDTTGQWGWLGELYAIMSANLASHFGSWTAMPVASYQTGQLKQYSAAIYVGSTYGEPLPNAFLDDVYATTTPVIWAYDNIWQLTARYPAFSSVYGWNWSGFDFSSVAEVDYPLPPSTRATQKLKRYAANAAGIMNYWSLASNVTVLANCVRSDGTTFPWAIRSTGPNGGSLTTSAKTRLSIYRRAIAIWPIAIFSLTRSRRAHQSSIARLSVSRTLIRPTTPMP